MSDNRLLAIFINQNLQLIDRILRMRYAEKWIKVSLANLDFEKVLIWCSVNLKGKQFIEGDAIKFDNDVDATKFKSEYKE